MVHKDGVHARTQFEAASRGAYWKYADMLATRDLQVVPGDGAIGLDQLKVLIAGFFPKNARVLFYNFESEVHRLRSWVIDDEGIKAFHERIIAQEEMETILAQFRASLEVDEPTSRRQAMRRAAPATDGRRGSTSGQRRDDEVQRAVEELLLPSQICEGVKGASHLIVVPVLNFGAVPFAMLRQSSGRRLVEDVALTLAPGLPTLGAVLDPLPAPPLNALVVGNPQTQTDPQWRFDSLPYAEREAREVAQILGVEALIGAEATTERIADLAVSAGRIHIAAHGIADSKNPLRESFLALTNGRWDARSIQQESFASDLAVLSACQTGLGKAHSGGIIGLARAFHLAGVPRVATTIWSVRDEPTAQIMADFERRTMQLDPAEAMRESMLALRADYPMPADWAGFTILGNPCRRADASSSAMSGLPYALALRSASTGALLWDGASVKVGEDYAVQLRPLGHRPQPIPEYLQMFSFAPGSDVETWRVQATEDDMGGFDLTSIRVYPPFGGTESLVLLADDRPIRDIPWIPQRLSIARLLLLAKSVGRLRICPHEGSAIAGRRALRFVIADRARSA